MKYSILFAAMLISVTTSVSAGAYLGTCYFEANNVVIIDGECDVFFDEENGDFSIYARAFEDESKEYAVALYVKSATTGEAIMKEVSQENSVEQSLGILTLNDRCWTSADVKLCTSEPYE